MQLLLRATAVAATTVALFTDVAAASQDSFNHHQQQQSLRRLKVTDVNNVTLDSAKQFSKDALDFITKLRGGDPGFYKNLITTMQIIMCDQSVKTDNHADGDETNAVWTGSDDLLLPYHRYVVFTYAIPDIFSHTA